MTDPRWWLALVTFERGPGEQDVLPDWAHGACGWMLALAPDEETARHLLVQDLTFCGLRVLEISDEQEVLSADEVEVIDDHLALNFGNMEPGSQTVWGTVHGYKGEGEA